MEPKKVIGSGKPLFSGRTKGLFAGIGVVAIAGLGFSSYSLWQNLSANAGGQSTLGRGWTQLGQIPTGGLSYSANASICKVPDTSMANGYDLQGRVEISGSSVSSTVTAGVYTMEPRDWKTGNPIDTVAGNVSTSAFTPAIASDQKVGVVLYGDQYTTVSGAVGVADIQSC